MKSACGLPSPGTGFLAVEYSGQRVQVAIALATASSESRLGPPAPKRSRDDEPTTIPDGASCPPTSGVDAGIPRSARATSAFVSGAAPAARSAARQSSG